MVPTTVSEATPTDEERGQAKGRITGSGRQEQRERERERAEQSASRAERMEGRRQKGRGGRKHWPPADTPTGPLQ